MKKIFALCITLALIISIMPANIVAFSAERCTVEFYHAEYNYPIREFTNKQPLYTKVTFNAPVDGKAVILTALYNKTGALQSAVTDTAENLTPGQETTYNTQIVNTLSDTEYIRVFVWEGTDNLVPAATNYGEIKKTSIGGGSSGGGIGGSSNSSVSVLDGVVTDEYIIKSDNIIATVSEGTKVDSAKLSLSVTELENPNSGITPGENEIVLPLDIHVEGISEDNTVPVIITVKEVVSPGLNKGNLALYHVENGEPVKMEEVESLSDLTKHNQFHYDPVTGTITLAMSTFSEVAVVTDTENAWNGDIDYSWYTNAAVHASEEVTADYIIANADQLAAFGNIVGGMNGQKQDSFAGKMVKLIADVNLGDKNNANESLIFHPIGYYYTDDENADGTTGDYYSTVKSFEGTFDGNGHTISNFYQNTWEIKGNYSGNYYKDAMGLFGYVVNGRVQNLTVDNFSSDGEFTPTGVIAAYAVNSTFENIAITNCNPRVYNTGNGGIVGIGGNSDDPDAYNLTFTNITIDNSNKISALWGSWDVACGGLVGMFRGDGHVHMTNCHVAAQLDVFNDVCGNYQYYWYRYSGMMVGTNKNMTTDANGYTVPETDKFHAKNCTVHFGEWNDYYYCELVANSLASYTHDHQFSRLEQVDSVDVANMTVTANGETTKIPSSGKCNYVVVKGEAATENATCYHFVDGKVWNHADAGEETVDVDGDGVKEAVLKEDRQHYYLPFNQLFTGYGWGVKHIPVYNGEKYAFEGITILDREVADSVVKFEPKFTGDFLYRVGNKNTVSLESLFKGTNDVNSASVYVTIDRVDENTNVSGTFTANTTDWTQGTIKFSGTGPVKVTIQDYEYCTPTVLYLEVVDAKNITTATGTTSGGDMVLLCDVNTENYVNYWNCALYGNGFTYSLNGAPTTYNSSNGHGVLITKNATLDNLVIVGDVYDEYGAYTNNNDYNAAIDIMGDTIIQNCYISGCSAPILTRANATITNTTLYGGAVGNLIIRGGAVTLDNVTTANYDDKRNAPIGMGIVIHSDASETAKLILNGTLTQYNFLEEEDTPTDTYAKNLHSAMFDNSLSQYHFGTSPNRRVNTGIISLTSTFNEEDITDNANTGYQGASVTLSGYEGYVYTQPNTSGSVNNNYAKETDTHIGTKQGSVPPSYRFDYTTKNYVAKADGSNDYCYEENGTVYISMDDGDIFNWDTSILTVERGNQSLNYTVSMNGTDYTGKSIAFGTAGDYKVIYTYTDTNNFKLDEDGNITTYSVTYTKTVNVTVAVIKDTTKHAEFTLGISNAATEKITIDNATYISATGVTVDNSKWTYITINGQKIYYPIVAAKLTSTKGSSSYAYFPVFEKVVTITDYADGGTGDAFTYNSSTTTLPSTLTVVKGIYKAASDVPYWYNLTNSDLTQSGASKIFKWASSSDAPSDPTTYNNVLCYKSPQVSADRVAYITLVQYSYTDATNTTYYYYVGYTLEAFTKQTTCVTPDTLVTLADGTQKRIDETTYGDKFLVWDFVNGGYTTAPASIIKNHGYDNYRVMTLNFADGTQVKTINGHGFFDEDINKFVIINEKNVKDYINHSFVKNGNSATELVSYSVKEEYTESWSILTAEYYNCILENMLTLTPAEVEGSPDYLMPFIIADGMKYDKASMEADIKKYGLYTYEEFKDVLSLEQFEALNLKYFKVAVGKGIITYDDILYLINLHM